MSDGLAAFLSARLDEKEAAAKAAAEYPGKDWVSGPGRDPGESVIFEDAGSPFGWIDSAGAVPIAAHIALHDPRRAFREVEADRKLLHALMHRDPLQGPEYGAGLRLAAMFRAEVYSDHPDYRPEWKP